MERKRPVPDRQQKNVRLSGQATQALRALKFDLELSDGEVIEQALAALTLRRAAYHISAVRRLRTRLLPETEGSIHRAALEASMYALNYETPRYRIHRTRLEAREGDEGWVPVRGTAGYAKASEEILVRARKLVTDLKQPRMTVPLLLIACCEGVIPGRFSGLGVPEDDLARFLRTEVGEGPTPPPSISYDLDSKAVILEGAYGIAALEGTDAVGPEHLLVACLQSPHPAVVRAIQVLNIDADLVRARLLEWLPEWDGDNGGHT